MQRTAIIVKPSGWLELGIMVGRATSDGDRLRCRSEMTMCATTCESWQREDSLLGSRTKTPGTFSGSSKIRLTQKVDELWRPKSLNLEERPLRTMLVVYE